MKKFIFLFFLICNLSFAEDYYFKECKLTEETTINYIIDLEKGLIKTTSNESSQEGEYPILVITKDQIITKQLQNKTHKKYYLQIYLNGKNNSVGIQRLKKEHEDGIFELIGEKNIGYCKIVKKDWDKKKEEKPEGQKIEEKILQVNSSLQKCEGDDPNNWSSCQGTYTKDNGSKYVGEFKNGNIIKGAILFPGGSKYVGDFKDGDFHGKGTFSYSDGSEYVGEWKNGKNHGYGSKTWKDGKKYIGEFENDKFNGKGTFLYSEDSKYVGEFKDGLKHGKGTMTYANGKTYIGQFVAGYEHGDGTCFDKEGSKVDCKKDISAKKKNTHSISIAEKKWIKLSEYESSSGKGKKIIDKLYIAFNKRASEVCSSSGNFEVLEKKTEILELDETPTFGVETVVKLGINGVVECK